ncbi:ATP-binding protein [Polynucleobacter sp. MWH-Spelu-300-X4]|uniref:ATP-binding protein n=1 Tax=Polynucleobacter sp. MWH-Spelu-300-X4 TaxID=2689109 RepID=UPI001BFCEAB8|nr:ATP-binding protein [Polynucleobacter sp. MWH-Spelu-300-X4]QWD80030.1 ATP-binding protein [Polynucleobacter sp. MWH-Spelu-300-X4]
MIYRNITPTLLRLSKTFPILGVTGPRQSGKTTLVRELFGDKPYVSLEEPDERAFAFEDPRGFLKRFEDGAIFDEAQRWPDLFSYLQGMVDQDRRPGRFVVTGSQQFSLLAGISQSLAGRIGMSRLLPLQWPEIKSLFKEGVNLDEHLLRGGYPAIYTTHKNNLESTVSHQDWFASYMTTYIERDVRQLINVHDVGVFQRFIKLCAARTGQLLNISALASEAGISASRGSAWLSILETSDLIYLLTPYHRNFGKRLVKSPKLYFVDTGLAAWLLGIRDKEMLNIHPMRGALFETYIVIEHLKNFYNQGNSADIHFWRDSNGVEADLVYEITEKKEEQIIQKLQTIEIKSGATVTSDYVKLGKKSGQFAGDEAAKLRLIYGGDESFERSGIDFVSWRDLLFKK